MSTNDRRLRAMCEVESIPVMWSLDLLVAMVGAGQLPSDEAIAIGADLHRISPRHITREILEALEFQIEAP